MAPNARTARRIGCTTNISERNRKARGLRAFPRRGVKPPGALVLVAGARREHSLRLLGHRPVGRRGRSHRLTERRGVRDIRGEPGEERGVVAELGLQRRDAGFVGRMVGEKVRHPVGRQGLEALEEPHHAPGIRIRGGTGARSRRVRGRFDVAREVQRLKLEAEAGSRVDRPAVLAARRDVRKDVEDPDGRAHVLLLLVEVQHVGTTVGILDILANVATGGKYSRTIDTAASLGFQFQTLHFSRDVEAAADATGARTCAAADSNPWGMVWLFKRFETLPSNGMPNFLSDHPSDEARIASLQAEFRDDPALFTRFSSNIANATPLGQSVRSTTTSYRPVTKKPKGMFPPGSGYKY